MLKEGPDVVGPKQTIPPGFDIPNQSLSEKTNVMSPIRRLLLKPGKSPLDDCVVGLREVPHWAKSMAYRWCG